MRISIESQKDRVSVISLIILLGFFFAVAFHYYIVTFFSYGPPFHTFFFSTVDQFGDFGSVLISSKDLSPYLKDGWALYFPIAYMFGYIFTLFDVKFSLLFFFVSIIIYSFFMMYRNLPINNIYEKILYSLALSVFTFPLIYCLDRGNFEGIVFIFLSLAILSFRKKIYLCNFFLSLSISMKLFPALFILLYFKDKKYKDILILSLYSIIFSVISLLLFEGSFFDNVTSFLKKLNDYQTLLALDATAIGFHDFGNSFFGVIKIIAMNFGVINLERIAAYYFYIIGALTLFLSYYVVFLEKSFWKNIAIITFAINCFPYISADYKMIHILTPLLFFINESKFSNNVFEIVYCILFGILLIPKNYGIGLPTIGYAGNLIDPFLMMLFSLCILFERFYNSYSDKTNEEIESVYV